MEPFVAQRELKVIEVGVARPVLLNVILGPAAIGCHLRAADALRETYGLASLPEDFMVDGRAYRRGLGENHVLALMAAGGTTFGRPSFEQSFEVGGFPDGSLLDVVRTNNAVLRGHGDGAFSGRRFVSGSVEYRISHATRPLRTVPYDSSQSRISMICARVAFVSATSAVSESAAGRSFARLRA